MKYIIWDFDGTLGYREKSMWAGTLLDIVEQEYPELNVTKEQIRSFLKVAYPWHTPERPHPELDTTDAWWEALYPVLQRALIGVKVPAERAEELARRFRTRYLDLSYWRLFPDTLPVLSQLSAAGWSHILLSNHVPELPDILYHLELEPCLAAVFNSAQTGYEKPHQQAFRNVLEWAVDADAIWMVGDNYTADVLGAESVGIPAILARQTHPNARYCCSELSDVIPIISSDLAFMEGALG